VSIFATPWHWRPLAHTGAILTAAPNPTTNTSSRGLRQCCLRLVWAASRGGGRNSIVLNVVCFSLFYFSAALPSNPFCPACIDCQQGPLPSRFPSPPSPLWSRHCHITLTLPLLVWHHPYLTLALSMLLLYLHCHQYHYCHDMLISLPLLLTYVPCIGRILSCHPCQY
jgi:hypothetical protein